MRYKVVIRSFYNHPHMIKQKDYFCGVFDTKSAAEEMKDYIVRFKLLRRDEECLILTV